MRHYEDVLADLFRQFIERRIMMNQNGLAEFENRVENIIVTDDWQVLALDPFHLQLNNNEAY